MSDLEILGAQFRRAREDRRLTFDQIERQTRIRAHYLEAIELGNFGVIPSPVQLRGFVRNYARAVGLDPDLMLAQVEEALANPSGRKPRKTPKTTTATTPAENVSAVPTDTLEKYRAPVIVPRASHSSMEVAAAPTYSTPHKRGPMRTVFAVVVATILTGVIIGGLLVAMNDLAEKSTEATQPSPLLELNPSNPTLPFATSTPTLGGVVVPPPINPTLVSSSSLYISITAAQRAWVRVIADGVTQFEGILAPGDGVQYPANQSITLKTTNAGGLQVKINNQDFYLGEPRQAFEQTFTLEGLITPTFAPTATATITYTPSATYTLGASITPTLTETPTLEGGLSAPVSPSNTTALLASPGVVSPTPLPPVGGDSSTPTTQNLATTLSAPTAILSPTPLVFNSPTYTPSRTPTNTLPPSSTPNITMTPSPFLPERATRTPTK